MAWWEKLSVPCERAFQRLWTLKVGVPSCPSGCQD
jgi:hypothetical protein